MPDHSSPPSRTFSPSPSSSASSPTTGRARGKARTSADSLRASELSDLKDDSERPNIGRQGRSETITSLGGFEFQHALLPLLPSGEDEERLGVTDNVVKAEERHVGLLHGIALVVGIQVGSGIFSSPGVVVGEVGSVGASLIVWVVSGILAWTGASSYTELGCAIPISGGSQAYLAYAFGPMASYLFTWAAVSVVKPGSTAMIALIFGEYVNRMIYHAISSAPDPTVPEWSIKLTALLAIAFVSMLNVISRTMGSNSSVVLTTIKVGSLLFVGVLGVVTLVKNGPGPALSAGRLFEGTSTNLSSYAIALYSGLWAFDGWDSCCYVAGEMKDTNRDLPRALHTSMTLVLALFVLANLSYFVVLDPSVVASSNTVALDFGAATIGKFGALLFSVLVSISCFGALNVSFFTTSRDNFLPSVFSRLHPRRRTPDNAVFLQVGLTAFFVIFGGGFRTLLNFFSVASWTFYLLTVLGLLVLRVKEPHLDRPYRAWLITPIVFCAVAMFLLLMPIFAAPLEAFAAFVFIGAGIPMYYLTARARTRTDRGFTADSSGGWQDTLRAAWANFREDVEEHLPSRWQSRRIPGRTDGLVRGDEVRGMLGGREERLEMAER